MNKHIVDITIVWPDDKWDQAAEQDYLLRCLNDVREHFIKFPIQNKEQRLDLINRFGRVFAEVHVSPCKGGTDVSR